MKRTFLGSRPGHWSLVCLIIILFGEPVRSQVPYVVPRIEGRITLDGYSTEPAWQAIEPLPLVMQFPTYQGSPTEDTEIRIGYTDNFLYVAGRCYDDSADVRSVSYERDQFNPGSDILYLFLDTFNDNKTGVGFIALPTGARTDFTIYNDAEGGGPVNFDWDTFWRVETVHNGDGWFCEMRIPFSSLRFQGENGQVEMGLIASRWIAHKSEFVGYPAIEYNYGPWSWTKPSLARTVEFRGITTTRPLYITPYVIGGRGRYAELNAPETAYHHEMQRVAGAGLDVKVGLARNLTLDVTLNPDFAQVEADNQQVNLTRFSLFYPEKRRFFQERASTFAFAFGGRNRLFYSRRIGLHQGHEVRILGGARLVGRVGTWDIGLLNMQTARAAGLSAENLGVLRLQREVFNRYSHIGGITTSRIGQDGSYNVGYGLDGVVRVVGDNYLTLIWAQTFDSQQASIQSMLETGHLRTQLERRSDVGLGYDLGYSRVGEAYQPDLGFQRRHDYSHFGDRIFYGWSPPESSSLLQQSISLHGEVFMRNTDGTPESATVGPGWSGWFRTNETFDIRLLRRWEHLRQPFDLSKGVTISANDYAFTVLRGYYNMSSRRRWETSVNVVLGTFYNGNRVAAGVTPSWNVSRHLDVSGAYRFERVRFPRQQTGFDAHILRLRIEGTLNIRLSGAAFIQYNTASNAVITNVRFRYNPREGNDLYLVYNHGLNTDRYRLSPYLPITDNRTVMLKYSHTENIGI